MRIYIKRGDQEYGPYPVDSLAQMVQAGNIVPHDTVRREDTGEVTTVAQLLAPAPPAPTPAPPAAPPVAPTPQPTPPAVVTPQVSYTPPAYNPPAYTPPATPAYAPPQAAAPVSAGGGPVPPGLQWWLVLILAICTCGLGALVWMFIQASFVKKIDPQSKAVIMLIAYLGCYVLSMGFSIGGAIANEPTLSLLGTPISLAGVAILIWNFFQMRTSLLDYYNRVENIGLRLSPIVTFFFAVFYFQHHFARINKWKTTGQLEPQTYRG